MTLDTLSLTNFKNIPTAQLSFSPKLNCFLGNNGMGKSNLLDAIHFLSFLKSMTGAPDRMLMLRGQNFAIIKAAYTRRGTQEDITIGLSEGHRKTVKRGGKEYPRISAHIGNFPSVLVSPADMDLVSGAAEDRRRFIDMAISQHDPTYLDALIKYNAALTSRNRLLRDNVTNPILYEALEMTMDSAAAIITSRRRAFTDRLRLIHRRYYSAIAGDSAELTDMEYIPSVPEGLQLTDTEAPGAFAMMLDTVRARDLMLHHTSVGPHRDDINFTLDGMPLRRTASQGQQKTFTIALRLAQYDFLAQATGLQPLLLLDDIFDKLDATRVEAIIKVVADREFGQIFITDTNRRHLNDIVGAMPAAHSLFSVTAGTFTPMPQL